MRSQVLQSAGPLLRFKNIYTDEIADKINQQVYKILIKVEFKPDFGVVKSSCMGVLDDGWLRLRYRYSA